MPLLIANNEALAAAAKGSRKADLNG